MADRLRFLPRVEALRGLAALTVALMHVTESWVDGPGYGAADMLGLKTIKALSNGYGAVVAFFVISGFVLARSLDRDFNAWRFARARIFRLFPAGIAAVALFSALFYAFGFKVYPNASFSPLNIAANMLMVRADIDVVMWSMKAELAATPLIFLCVWLARRHGPERLLPVALVLFGLSFVGQYCHAIGTDTNLGPLFAFPVGIWLHFKGASLVDRLKSPAVMAATLASVAVFCACAFFTRQSSLNLLADCLSASVLLALVANRVEDNIFALLDLAIVRFYGKISYSFYLLHPLSLWPTGYVTSYLEQHESVPVTVRLLIGLVISLAVITPLAYASWRFVERPALAWRRARPITEVSGELQPTH